MSEDPSAYQQHVDEHTTRLLLMNDLSERMLSARKLAESFSNVGKKELAIQWYRRALQLSNQLQIEKFETTISNTDAEALYTDLSKPEESNFIDKARSIELCLFKDSPLYIDILDVLKKHLEDH